MRQIVSRWPVHPKGKAPKWKGDNAAIPSAKAFLPKLQEAFDRSQFSLGYKCPEGPHGVCCGEPKEDWSAE